MNRREYLNILSIHEGFTLDELKSAYKREALKWHPDQNKNFGAKEHFLKLTEAYQYLSKHIKSERIKEKVDSEKIKQRFHRPVLDLNSETYQKIKKIGEIVFGEREVAKFEKNAIDTTKSIEEIFDILGI